MRHTHIHAYTHTHTHTYTLSTNRKAGRSLHNPPNESLCTTAFNAEAENTNKTVI